MAVSGVPLYLIYIIHIFKSRKCVVICPNNKTQIVVFSAEKLVTPLVSKGLCADKSAVLMSEWDY